MVSPLTTVTVAGTAGQFYEFDVTNYLKQQKTAGATGVAFALKAVPLSLWEDKGDTVVSVAVVDPAPEHVAAARKAAVEENAGYLTAMHTGRYTDLYLKTLGADAPKFTPEDMRIIGSKTDFQGLNIYTGNYYIAADNERGYEAVPFPSSYPNMQSSWIQFAPDAMYWGPKLMAEALGISDIYITENGTSSTAAPDAEGRVLDIDRVMFLRQYLGELQRGIVDGAPVRGYFLWSLLDNFEWSRGYSERFGITYVDFATQKRTPKLSSQFYRDVIGRNAL